MLLLLLSGFSLSWAFSQAPTIETIIPCWGPPAGGTNFTVKGTNFQTGAIVSINSIDCTTTFVDAETLTATSPNMGTYGAHQVRVRNTDGQYAIRGHGFSAIEVVYYVKTDGNDALNGLTPANAKLSIQKLIDAKLGGSNPPDDGPIEVRLEQGTYKENLWLRNRLVLTGGWSDNFTARDPDQYITILDGDYDNMCARTYGLGAVITVDGLSMINGRRIGPGGAYKSSDDYSVLTNNVIIGNRAETKGGAVYLTFNNDMFSGVVSQNLIVGNRTDFHGGGGVTVFSYGTYLVDMVPDVAISSNYIVGNKAKRGGGIFIYPDYHETDKLRIKNNIIAKNKATEGKGGGIYFANDASIYLLSDIKNNLIRDNTSKTYGGGFLIDGGGIGTYAITNNTITANSALWFGDGLAVYDSNTASISARNSIFYFNNLDDIYDGPNTTSVIFSNIEEGFSGAGNISSDPLFEEGPMGSGYLSQVAAGQPLNSPCIDSGTGTAASAALDSKTTRTDEMGDAGTVDMGFHYKSSGIPDTPAAPTIASILPAAGSFKGGDWIVVRGNGFRNGIRVFIDNVQSPDVILITERKLIAEAPASVGGKRALVNVETRNADDQSYTAVNGFRYADVAQPKWSSTIGVQSAIDAQDCSLGIILRWGSATDTDSPPVSYNIYRTTIDPYAVDGTPFIPTKKGYASEPNGYRPITYLTNVPDLTYLDSNVSKGTKYWYIVQAVDSANAYGEVQNRELNGILSNDEFGATATTLSNTIPPSPVGNTLTATLTVDKIKVHLDWTASVGAFKYNVYRGIEKNNVTNLIYSTPNGYTTEYDDEPPAGTIYFYKIKAADTCSPANEANE